MPFNLGFMEMLVLMGVSVLVFGGRLPEVARKVASTISEFKRGMREEFNRLDTDIRPPDVDAEPPADWERPPDGADCTGLGSTELDGEAPEPKTDE